MAGTIYGGTYSSTIDLSNVNSTVASTGVVSTTNQVAIYGSVASVWTLTNFGSVQSTLGTSGAGVLLEGGGSVTNGSSTSTTALIAGATDGVALGSVGTVANYGTIVNTASIVTSGTDFFFGVFLVEGGVLTNGAPDATQALIRSSEGGVYTGGSRGASNGDSGTVVNFGTVETTGTGTLSQSAIVLASGGSIQNNGTIESAGANGARLRNGGSVTNNGLITAHSDAINVAGSVGIVTNFGTLQNTAEGSGYAGVYLGAGGTVTNEAGGLITAYHNAVNILNTAAQVINYGNIANTGTHNAIYFNAGGSVTNGSADATGATIESDLRNGVNVASGIGTISNFGTIIGAGTSSSGVALDGGGSLTNTGLITGYARAIATLNAPVTLTNLGTLSNTSSANAAVYIGGGGSLTNGSPTRTTALINSPNRTGISARNAPVTVINYGTIESGAPASGTFGSSVYLLAGGTIINAATGLISAERHGVTLGGTVASSGTAVLINSGDITGNIGVNVSSLDSGANTIIDYGTITGTGGNAIQLSGGENTVVIEPGASLGGGIGGFAPGDTIDFGHVIGTSAEVSNGVLDLMNGTTVVASVGLPGTFGSDTFTVGSDKAGGTDVQATSYGNQLSGDGLSDALMTDGSAAVVLDEVSGGTMGYTQVSGIGPEWQFGGDGPLLGDGHDQALLWYGTDDSPTYGALVVGEDDGGTLQYTQIGAIGPEWQFEGVGPIAGAGNADFLLWDGSSASPGYGAVVVGAVSGTTASYTQIGAIGPEWQFEGVGDFLNNGSTDFLIWDTSSSSPGYGAVVAGQDVSGTAQYTQIGGLDPTAWQFEGSGNLLGDGLESVLIRNVDTGALVVGEDDGGSLQYTQIGGVGPEWQFLGVGDYDGKSPAEFLMFNQNGGSGTGALVIGTVAGGTATYTAVGGVGPSQWTFHPTSPALLS